MVIKNMPLTTLVFFMRPIIKRVATYKANNATMIKIYTMLTSRVILVKNKPRKIRGLFVRKRNYLLASSIATATATVIPTMGLLPAPMRPIISTWAGTEEEPANCASPCIRPMVSVIP